MQVNIMQHLRVVHIGKAHMINVNIPLFDDQVLRAGLFLQGRLHGHHLFKSPQAGHAAGEDLGKLCHLPDRCDKRADKQGKCDQINIIHLVLHNQPAACRNDHRRKNSHEKLLGSVKDSHRPVEILFCAPVLVVRVRKTAVVHRFIREGLRSLHAGQTGLYVRVDAGKFFLHICGGF